MTYSSSSYSQAPYSAEGEVVDPNVSIDVTGVNATGAVGTLTVTGNASTTLTGVAGTGSVGTVSAAIVTGKQRN